MRRFIFRLPVFFQGAIFTPSFQQLLVKRQQAEMFNVCVDSKGKRLVLSRDVVNFHASIKVYLQMARRIYAPDHRLRNSICPGSSTAKFHHC